MVFRKHNATPPLDETCVPHVKKVKPTQKVLPSSSQPRASKREKRGAQRPKRPKGEKSSIANDTADDPPPTDIQPVRHQISTV